MRSTNYYEYTNADKIRKSGIIRKFAVIIMYEQKPLKTKFSGKISEKTMGIHHGKLYKGYVDKGNEVGEKLGKLRKEIIAGTAPGGNATYSELRALKDSETFAANGVYLHENYFDILGSDGDWSKAPELSAAISEKWGSVEDFMKYFTECAMAARGWAILAWNPYEAKLMQYNGDAHNHGGVWGCIPIIACDVYEHAYFIDFGSDRKSYITEFFAKLDWEMADEIYKKAKEFIL